MGRKRIERGDITTCGRVRNPHSVSEYGGFNPNPKLLILTYKTGNLTPFLMPTYDKHYKTPDYFGQPYPELVSFFTNYEPKGTLLDLGCGQGRDSISLARLGYQVIGVDISEVGVTQMLSIAEKENLDIKGIVANIYDYRIDDTIDIVLLDTMLHFYPRDREKETGFLKRIMSELKPGGVLCVVVWRSKKIEVALETTLDTNTSWKKLIDKYIRYPEKEMEMRMLVLEKSG